MMMVGSLINLNKMAYSPSREEEEEETFVFNDPIKLYTGGQGASVSM
jgi:hypothetical protein